MSSCKYLFFALCFIFTNNIFSQNNFYDIDTVRECRIYFYDTNWDYILDSLYVLGEKDRLLADIRIDGIDYDSVGVRYKGFSSVDVNRLKNPFNIKLDYIIENQEHEGIEKLKLSNVIYDPSFIREVLSYEIIRKYMYAPQANFMNLYINDTLWGLYTNVEAVNNDFLIDNFDSKYNSFFKCNPENIDIQIGGENSNLSNTHGPDSMNYSPYYDIRSDNGWSDLYSLIDLLNNSTDSINNILNVDRVLWMHALNYTLINFDSYIGYSQNYYLYMDESSQWNPILWDLNMSLGAFRLTDASSLYFNGFDISQAINMDPLTHLTHFSVSPRPLLRNLLINERYRKMYIAHIRTIVEENFINQEYYIKGQDIYNLIDQYVQNDTNKFYSYNDFVINLTNQVSLPSSICPGITQLMDGRSNYLSSYRGYLGEPQIIQHTLNIQTLSSALNAKVTVEVNDASYVSLAYRFGKNDQFKYVEMFDDGNHNDGNSGDGIYGCEINNCSNMVDYYFYADNDSAGVFDPVRAAHNYYTTSINTPSNSLVINELMSNNQNIATDPSGQYEDWIELYNNSNIPINTNKLYLSDTITNLNKWKLPSYVIYPDDYLIIWADEDGSQGERHSNFKLSNLGETIILSDTNSNIIDSVTYLPQADNISYARVPNAIGDFTNTNPTFSANNDASYFLNFNNEEVSIFPNPFNNFLNINFDGSYYVFDVVGRKVLLSDKKFLNTSSWQPGIYFIHLNGNYQKSIKAVKVN